MYNISLCLYIYYMILKIAIWSRSSLVLIKNWYDQNIWFSMNHTKPKQTQRLVRIIWWLKTTLIPVIYYSGLGGYLYAIKWTSWGIFQLLYCATRFLPRICMAYINELNWHTFEQRYIIQSWFPRCRKWVGFN